MEKGLIQVYTGDGKGKTTAAMGLAIRCAGCGFNVQIIQFMKAWNTGELASLKKFENISVKRVCSTKEFSFKWTKKQMDVEKENANACLDDIKDIYKNGIDLLILDEVLGAINAGILDEEMLVSVMNNKPKSMELVITGRNATKRIIEMADLVTEMKVIKHYMDDGVMARKGIEF